MSENHEYDREGHIVVDHIVRTQYPDSFVGLDQPQYENTGFMEYHLSSLRLWLHPEQKRPCLVKAEIIYSSLKEVYGKNLTILDTCLNLHDGHAIAKKGPIVFQKYFKRQEVYLWKSVIICKEENEGRGAPLFHMVPFLCVRGNRVVILWRWSEDYLYYNDPALCFQSNLRKD